MPVVGEAGTITFRLRLQVLLAAIDPFEKVKDAAPATGEKVGLPQPEATALGVGATNMAPGEVGKLSEKLTPDTADEVGLTREILSVAEPPATVALGENALAMVTWAGSTIEMTRAELEKSAL